MGFQNRVPKLQGLNAALHGRGCLKLRRLVWNRQVLIAVVLVYAIIFLTFSRWSRWTLPLPYFSNLAPSPSPPRRMTNNPPVSPLPERVPCFGPRGQFLSRSPDDDVREAKLNISYPMPFTGSYEALGLDQSWISYRDRYAPYGYGEDDEGYNRTRVDWDRIDWGKLQNECFDRNAHRFPTEAKPFDNMVDAHRLDFRNRTMIPEIRQWHDFNSTRRTAVVLRVWRGYEYKVEDMHYIRSLIVETALRTGGEYQVILLVDMKEYDRHIYDSTDTYQEALRNSSVPPELRSIAILWDDRLLENWYPAVNEHRTMWQVYQPMQLLALHYPEFDHMWQFELDIRFTGDAGKYLDRMGDFARNEPRKQALERATFQHMQQRIGSYQNFSAAVNASNNGSAYLWGPLRIPDLLPIGPEPPTLSPADDDFRWGVGEEADVIVTSLCNNASAAMSWIFRDWLFGFSDGLDTTRFFCPPAITRTSRTLLLAVHQAQVQFGMTVPSEATPPSFAVWHGLKLSFPQQPVFFENPTDDEYMDGWWKGGPANSSTGVGPDLLAHPRGYGLSFWWETLWPRLLYDAWEGREIPEDVPFPWILAKDGNGTAYMPNMMMHPVKHHD
ncbi:hypothetical protein B0T17DRAFT_490451 [Bombardia bombarda]|uniref:Uncharacterized protein n=1 Tax=Bombardia bombarda TaxID=252184 RepID=A0AA40CAP6_9PEZI|nr:hypothetical protein B0T17DRAFT_490451 [Bombardia bombarda]